MEEIIAMIAFAASFALSIWAYFKKPNKYAFFIIAVFVLVFGVWQIHNSFSSAKQDKLEAKLYNVKEPIIEIIDSPRTVITADNFYNSIIKIKSANANTAYGVIAHCMYCYRKNGKITDLRSSGAASVGDIRFNEERDLNFSINTSDVSNVDTGYLCYSIKYANALKNPQPYIILISKITNRSASIIDSGAEFEEVRSNWVNGSAINN